MNMLKFGFTASQIISDGRVTQQQIDQIKVWVAIEKDVPMLTDEQIVLFLLCCRSDPEATCATIHSCYSIKKENPWLFDNRTLKREDLQKQMRTGYFCIFPRRTDEGHAVVFCKFHDTRYYNFEMGAFIVVLLMVIDAALYNDPPTGIVVVCDMNGFGLRHLMQLRLGILRTCSQYLQEGLGIEIKHIHILNTVSFINKVIHIIKPFMKPEILYKMQFHSTNVNFEYLYEKVLPKKCLPENYGGDLPSLSELHQSLIKKLTDLETFFEMEELQRRNCYNY